MRVATMFAYLIGRRGAILEVASDRAALGVGAVLVLSAALARSYDQAPLLYQPWRLLGPFVASVAISGPLFLTAYGFARWKGMGGPGLGQAYRSFLDLYWMTAPLAWLYGIPYERFLSPVGAVEANLRTLALVSAWRVVLMVRVVSVVFGLRLRAALPLVMLVADVAVLAALHLVPLPVIQLMGGISPEQDTVAWTALLVKALAWLTLPVWIVSAAIVAYSYRDRPEWRVPPSLDRPAGGRRVAAFAGLVVLAWAAVLPFTQPAQDLARRVERTYEQAGPAAALALMSAHDSRDFPPGWQPPPRRFPGHPPTGEVLDMLEAFAEYPQAGWVRDLYRRRFQERILYDSYQWPDELLGRHAARLAEILTRMREGPALAQALQYPDRHIEDWLGPNHQVTGDHRAALETLLQLSRRAEGHSSVPIDRPDTAGDSAFVGSGAGDERQVLGIKLCWCPPGRFTMGSPPDEPERRPGESQVEVRHTKGFWIGKYEVTQGDWRRVVGELPGELTAELPAGDDYPVGNVSFAEAEGFCRELAQRAIASKELPADWEFRLPTEAQWEYACRAGTTTATAFGDSLGRRQANFRGRPYNGAADDGPSLGRAARVGGYAPNAWGVHDMHGNAFEWCRDWYHPTLPGGDDPDLYPMTTTSRVRRGGCWADDGWPCRSASRLRFEPERRSDHIGFRIVAVRR